MRAWRLAFVETGFDVSSARIHRMIGAGSDVLQQELIGRECQETKDAWRRHFDDLKTEVAAFAGASDLLEAVAERGAAVMLATSSEPDDVEVLVEAIGATEAITGITSAGDVDSAKPSPEVFEAALKKSEVEAADAIVVGDTTWDIEAAARAGLRCVTLCSGGRGRRELEEAGALAVYSDPLDLLDNLKESPIGRLIGLEK